MRLAKPISNDTDVRLDSLARSPAHTFRTAMVLVMLATACHGADRSESVEPVATLLEQDWLFQAGGEPGLDRTRQEITRARKFAETLRASSKAVDLSRELNELARLERQLRLQADGSSINRARRGSPDPAETGDRRSHSRLETFGRTGGSVGRPATASGRSTEKLYLAVRQLKRRIMFMHAAIDFSEILCIDQPRPRSGHESTHRHGRQAVPGGRLLILAGLHPEAQVRHIGPQTAGSYWRPDLSFDGRQVLFCFNSEGDKAFHLYEVGVNGRDLKQLTFGDYDDLDPIYLPDGKIMFVTTRGHSYARCIASGNAYVLARCDAEGKNIYLISRSNENDWLPALLEDGRVIYSRWEYTDKPLWRIQSLWTTNPDGTNTTLFWGNQSVWPDHLAQPRPIPGTNRVMFTAVGHHQWFGGSIGIIDPGGGREFPHGLTKVTADVPWPEVGNGPVDPVECSDYTSPGPYDAYHTPFPLSEDLFLVSAKRRGDAKFRLYLMDIRGNLELIHESSHNIWHAMPLKPRPQPPGIPDRVQWPGTGNERQPAAPGTFYSADVYEGVPDLPRGMVKYLRVFQQEHTTWSEGKKLVRWGHPGISAVQEDGVKRILGVVPVHEDGSVYFQIPAGKMLYFQLLDEHSRALQTMRSFTGVMPGESRGCVGCHEMHNTAPLSRPAFALRSSPAELAPPPWGDETIGYERFVQPVLDRYCVKCHRGKDDGSHPPDLRLRPGYRFMKEPYLTLVGPAVWKEGNQRDLTLPDANEPGFGLAGIYPVEAFAADEIIEPFKWYNGPNVRPEDYAAKYGTLRPMTTLSYKSALVELAMNGKHYDVKVDSENLRRLIAWVDAMGPYRGEPEVRDIPDPDFEGIEEFAIRPRTRTAPRVPRP